MRLKMAALMITLVLVLSACTGGRQTSPEQFVRQHYSGITAYNARGEITADYGDKVYRFAVAISGDLTSGQLEVTAPASVAGTAFRWVDGRGVVSYGDVTLETGGLSPDGLSPVDAMPVVLNALVGGTLVTAGEEQLEGEKVIFLELTPVGFSPEQSTVLVWVEAESCALRRWEITWEGTTVVSCQIAEYSDTTQVDTMEG